MGVPNASDPAGKAEGRKLKNPGARGLYGCLSRVRLKWTLTWMDVLLRRIVSGLRGGRGGEGGGGMSIKSQKGMRTTHKGRGYGKRKFSGRNLLLFSLYNEFRR